MYEPTNAWVDVESVQTRKEWLEDCIITATGFCGCGDPGSAYKTLRDVLTILRVRSMKWHGIPFDKWYPGFTAGLEKTIAYRSKPGAAYGYLYWLDHVDLTTHGGSVPGWLTQKGELVLEWLNEMLGLENKY